MKTNISPRKHTHTHRHIDIPRGFGVSCSVDPLDSEARGTLPVCRTNAMRNTWRGGGELEKKSGKIYVTHERKLLPRPFPVPFSVGEDLSGCPFLEWRRRSTHIQGKKPGSFCHGCAALLLQKGQFGPLCVSSTVFIVGLLLVAGVGPC